MNYEIHHYYDHLAQWLGGRIVPEGTVARNFSETATVRRESVGLSERLFAAKYRTQIEEHGSAEYAAEDYQQVLVFPTDQKDI